MCKEIQAKRKTFCLCEGKREKKKKKSFAGWHSNLESNCIKPTTLKCLREWKSRLGKKKKTKTKMPHVSSQAFLWVENALYHLPSSCYSCLDSVSTEQKNGIYGSRLPRGCQNSACLTTRKEDSWCLHWCERWRRKTSNSCLIEPKVRWDRYFMPSWSEVCGARKLPVP